MLQTSTSSAFASTGLEQILKNMHVVYPIFIGSFTDGCAQPTPSVSRKSRLERHWHSTQVMSLIGLASLWLWLSLARLYCDGYTVTAFLLWAVVFCLHLCHSPKPPREPEL